MTVALAFVGAGGIASIHLKNLEARDDVEVVAVCDVVREAAERAASPWDAAVYTDHEALFDAEDPDAVVVAVPPFAHEGQEVLAAERGVHLFVEKPIGLLTETADEVEAAIEDAGVLSQVGHMLRYAGAVEKARELIGDRDVALVDGRWIGGVPGASWWGVEEKSGGQVVEQTAHVFDLVRYFGGEVEAVRAAGGKRVVGDEIDFEDAVSATMTHENGTVSHVSTSAASPDDDVSLTLVGDGFHLDLAFDSVDGTPPKSVSSLAGVVDGESVAFEFEECAWRTEVDAFVESVKTGDASGLRSSYADARRTFDLTLAVTDALDREGPVSPEPGERVVAE
ncbi:Gfo/Idh/MocA family protein [Halegenticoccus tardaugens]|uniref:Gfo/Idh/MocA family protein n=1 Tax=Halegenticoccus tardaugens TaxID=2071624 RepID=UPI00100B4185|nr:Gfo/Idh/MocA family oxidoreductase [Halegenticoccus tardaugens]